MDHLIPEDTMAKAKDVNEIEVTRDARIAAEAAKIKAREEAEILAEATAKVEAELAVEADAQRAREQEQRDAEAKVEARAARSKSIADLGSQIAGWMSANDCDNPSAIPGNVVDGFRRSVGL